MKKFILAILFIVSGCLSSTAAQTVEKKPSPQWWLSSSFADTVEQYLFHAEAQYSYTKMSGTIAGEMHSGKVSTAVRKSIFTLHADYFIDKTDLSLKSLGMNYLASSQAFTSYLDVDATPLLYGEGGFIWEKDNTLYLKNRYTFYIGAGLNGIIYKQHYLKILFAAGTINQQYTVPVGNFDVVKGAHSAFYIKQQYKYVINPILSFMEEAYYLNDIDYTNRYRLGVILNVRVIVAEPVALMLGYNYRFDKESELLGAIPKNTTQSIGVMLNL